MTFNMYNYYTHDKIKMTGNNF